MHWMPRFFCLLTLILVLLDVTKSFERQDDVERSLRSSKKAREKKKAEKRNQKKGHKNKEKGKATRGPTISPTSTAKLPQAEIGSVSGPLITLKPIPSTGGLDPLIRAEKRKWKVSSVAPGLEWIFSISFI